MKTRLLQYIYNHKKKKDLQKDTIIDVRHDAKFKDTSCTITTRVPDSDNYFVVVSKDKEENIMSNDNVKNLRIRKLTPKECWRLQGFDDEDVDKAAKVVSPSQLYKQAGNSITVNVLEAIFTNLFLKDKEDLQEGGLF